LNPEIAEVLAGSRRWTVLNSDNRDVLPTLPAKSVAHVITDPPYEAEAHTRGRRLKGKTLSAGIREVLEVPLSFGAIGTDERDTVAAEFGRIASRWIIAFCQVEAATKWSAALKPTPTKRIGVWVKPDAMPQFSGDRPGMGYESIVFAHAKGRSRWNGGGRVGVFTHNKNSPGGAHFHETQKPLPLMLELVELFTDPDDIVLDPFCGSGTTGVACLRLGRRFIGIEMDATYAQVATERLAAEVQGLSLRDSRAGQLPMFGRSP
jgi:site-specific DNA-methyltransferase (adenine-specific)